MTLLNADFYAIFKKPVKTDLSDPDFERFWELLIVGYKYHVIAVCENTGDYVLEGFDREIIWEKEAFEVEFIINL